MADPLYGYADRMAALKETYARWGALVILVKGLTPIPFKLVTIVSGLLGYNFPLFVALSIITRGGRFLLLAAALNHFGDRCGWRWNVISPPSSSLCWRASWSASIWPRMCSDAAVSRVSRSSPQQTAAIAIFALAF